MRRILLTVLSSVLTLVPLDTPRVPATPAAPSHTPHLHRTQYVAPSRPATHRVVLVAYRRTSVARPRAQLVSIARRYHVTVSQLRNAWQRVAVCEVGGDWSMVGPTYSGIGFATSTWDAYGGLVYAPYAGQAAPAAQIVVAMRVVRGRVPDQAGCSPTGW